MASSEVDQKFLGNFAKNIGSDNPLLSAMLFKILGLSVILSKQLIRARKLRKLDPTRATPSLELYFHILWLSREGLDITETYILPMIGHYGELKVLSYKLRASFYHIFVLFHNQPSITRLVTTPPGLKSPTRDKGKGIDRAGALSPASIPSSLQSAHPLELGGPVRSPGSRTFSPSGGPTDYSRPPPPSTAATFLLPAKDYVPLALSAFTEADNLASTLLWGSHPLRLSVKLEFAAFLYDCCGERDRCRELCKRTIREVYEAQEGMDDDMFEDAAELVGILGRMMKRGLGSSGKGSVSGKGSGGSRAGSAGVPSEASKSTPRMGMGAGGSGTLSGTRTPGMDNMI